MVTETLKLAKKSFDNPDGVRELPNIKMEWVDLQDSALGRVTLQPGWQWSKDVRPEVDTESCQCSHLMYTISGRMIETTRRCPCPPKPPFGRLG